MTDWVQGSHLSLAANDRYALGKPKLAEIEIRFLTDFNTISANLMAGAVEMLGWLELTLDDSKHVVLAGFNEGSLPGRAAKGRPLRAPSGDTVTSETVLWWP